MRFLTSQVALAVCLALTLGVGFLSGIATQSGIATWYPTLAKPVWTPPNTVFPVVWTTLYALMGVTLWLLWQRTAASFRRKRAITLFFVQLVLNGAWSPVFFTLHQPWIALVIIIAMIVCVALMIRVALQINRAAALIQLPYLAWIAYASTLNAGIAVLN